MGRFLSSWFTHRFASIISAGIAGVRCAATRHRVEQYFRSFLRCGSIFAPHCLQVRSGVLSEGFTGFGSAWRSRLPATRHRVEQYLARRFFPGGIGCAHQAQIRVSIPLL